MVKAPSLRGMSYGILLKYWFYNVIKNIPQIKPLFERFGALIIHLM